MCRAARPDWNICRVSQSYSNRSLLFGNFFFFNRRKLIFGPSQKKTRTFLFMASPASREPAAVTAACSSACVRLSAATPRPAPLWASHSATGGKLLIAVRFLKRHDRV